MKLILIVLIAIFLFESAFTQNAKIESIKYKHKVDSYKRMKNTGAAFLAFGVPATICGVALMVKGNRQIEQGMNYSYTYDPNTGGYSLDDNEDEFNKGSRNMMLGGLMAYVGVPLTVLGAIFLPIGDRKSKQYQELLDNMSLGAYYYNDKKGLVLRYTF